MKNESILWRVFRFYVDGFRSMTVGKTLWCIILIKLFIMFCLLKPFFFPRFLGQFDTRSEQEEYVSSELVDRAIIP
ncbi:MAG: DUF4492 domain-containing protein [Tannerella sp.]|jgi:hypothetical protein|nr:DUF4492 domain-containing protein [Tannerella sp.]